MTRRFKKMRRRPSALLRKWLLWGVLTLLVLLLLPLWLPLLALALFWPFRYSVQGQYGKTTHIAARFNWFLACARYEHPGALHVRVFGFPLPQKWTNAWLTPPEKQPQAHTPLQKRWQQVKNVASHFKDTPASQEKTHVPLAQIDWGALFAPFKKFLRRMLRRLKPKRFYLAGCFGFDDPAATGKALGLYEAFAHALGLHESIQLYGDFTQKRLDITLNMRGRFCLSGLLWPAAALFFSAPVQDALATIKGEKPNDK